MEHCLPHFPVKILLFIFQSLESEVRLSILIEFLVPLTALLHSLDSSIWSKVEKHKLVRANNSPRDNKGQALSCYQYCVVL